jgi:hypothetical protein
VEFGGHVSKEYIGSIFRVKEYVKEKTLPPISAGFSLELLFDPENGGDMFTRNVILSVL